MFFIAIVMEKPRGSQLTAIVPILNCGRVLIDVSTKVPEFVRSSDLFRFQYRSPSVE
jgi:hypothetical protein